MLNFVEPNQIWLWACGLIIPHLLVQPPHSARPALLHARSRPGEPPLSPVSSALVGAPASCFLQGGDLPGHVHHGRRGRPPWKPSRRPTYGPLHHRRRPPWNLTGAPSLRRAPVATRGGAVRQRPHRALSRAASVP
jgi:hypothetical protein